jgi:beta-lactamase class A
VSAQAHPARAVQQGRVQQALAGAVASSTERFPGAEVHLALADLASGLRWGLRDAEKVHAASTMKLPVLMAAHRRIAAGALRVDQPVRIRNAFASLAGGAPFVLDSADDSDPALYAREGSEVPLGELLERMIVRSSNLATNLLLQLVPPGEVTRMARALGALDLEVLRGVEDSAAFRAGLNNVLTARDLLALLCALGEDRVPGAQAMVATLARQEFSEGIPQGVPEGTRVAHKTGAIAGHYHDAGLVFAAEQGAADAGPGPAPARASASAAPYALVVLTRGFPAEADAVRAVRAVSAAAWAALRD